jgi:hypothetical protein
MKGPIMNSKALLAIAAVAAIASTGAFAAGDAYPSQYAIHIDSSRTRAAVKAEAAAVPKAQNAENSDWRVAPVLTSPLQAKAVRQEAAHALRLGEISSGEVDHM